MKAEEKRRGNYKTEGTKVRGRLFALGANRFIFLKPLLATAFTITGVKYMEMHCLAISGPSDTYESRLFLRLLHMDKAVWMKLLQLGVNHRNNIFLLNHIIGVLRKRNSGR